MKNLILIILTFMLTFLFSCSKEKMKENLPTPHKADVVYEVFHTGLSSCELIRIGDDVNPFNLYFLDTNCTSYTIQNITVSTDTITIYSVNVITDFYSTPSNPITATIFKVDLVFDSNGNLDYTTTNNSINNQSGNLRPLLLDITQNLGKIRFDFQEQ